MSDQILPAAEILGGIRLRRNRHSRWSREMVRENSISPSDLIWPLFCVEGQGVQTPVTSMPGVQRWSVDLILERAREAVDLGIPAVAIFPYTDPALRDDDGSEALNADNLVCRACRTIKEAGIDIGIMTDVALDPYTSHGQDGLVQDGKILNDETVEILARAALIQAQAGADIIAPSDMMDGRVGVIRSHLDANGFEDLQIMSYTAKYASGFYGPFRDAVGSNATLKGDKKTYQMDPANADEALREAEADIAEGADMIMVKPGMPYLDIIQRLSAQYAFPTFAYQVSGEYAMLHAAAANGWLDLHGTMMESMMAFKRAGAKGVLSYFAPEIAKACR